jgi:signal transduction histidine kinase
MENIKQLLAENEALKAELLVLKAREEKNDYKRFFHHFPDIVVVVNIHYLFEYLHIPNIPTSITDTMIGKDAYSNTPAPMRAKMMEAFEKVFKNKEIVIYESEGESLGAYKYFSNYLTPILDEQGTVTHAYMVSKDISNQKKSEFESKSLQQNLSALFHSMKHVCTIFDLELNVIWFNEVSSKLTYLIFNKQIEIGTNPINVFPPPVYEAFKDLFEKAKSGIPIKYTRKYSMEDEYLVYEFSLLPIMENNKLLAIAHIGIDVTELALKEENSKIINQELVLQNQQLNQYSNIISHNLRGPISTLMGIANIIDSCREDEILVDKLLKQVKPITQKLDTILQDLNVLLNYKDQENSVRQKVDLNLLLEDIKDFFDITNLNQISILSDFKEATVLFTIRGYIHSILFNLVSNAIKYKKINEEAIIKLKSYKTTEGKICIEISDNGLGIDLEKHGSKLFGFYKRFHNHVEGKGIGLHMTKTQIELLGGSIEVESKVMVGSVFKIYLPEN